MADNKQVVNEETPSLVVGLDIGTSKVLAVVAEVNDHHVIIRGLSRQKTYGVNAGEISDIEQVAAAVKNAITDLEQQSECRVYSLSASLSGKHIECYETGGMVPINRKEVTYKDKQEVLNTAYDMALPQGSEIINMIPQEYEIDKQKGITNPIGMAGIRLAVKALAIAAASNALDNTRKCIRRCNFDVDHFVFQGLASSIAVLTEDEKRLGVCLVDIGSGTLDLAIYINGQLKDVVSIPFGGDFVTMDIARVMHMSTDLAESFKVKYGSASVDRVPHGEMVSMPVHQGVKTVSRADLAAIIEPRYDDFFGLIRQTLKSNYYDHMLGAGLVFTGGAANIDGFVDAAISYFDQPVRVGYVKNVQLDPKLREKNINISDPEYANVIGLLRTQQEYLIHHRGLIEEAPKLTFLQKVKKGLKQYF